MMKATDNNRTARLTPGRRSLFAGASAVFLLFIATTVYSAEFQGNLNSVSITDAAGANTPPLARFTYSQTGDNITFDASTSYDPDGGITQYKWNFDGRVTATGASATYTHTATTPLQVTLTVKDNNDGISMIQESIGSTSSPSNAIYDDFSSNTSTYYSEVSAGAGSVNTASGVYSATMPYAYTTWLRNTPLSSINSYVEAVGRFNSTGRIAVAIRSSAASKTGYYIYLNGDGVVVKDCKNINFSSSCQFVSQTKATWYNGVNHTLRVEISGDELNVYVDSIHSSTSTLPSSYSNMQVGVGVYAGSSPSTTYITSFKADNL